NDIKLFGDFNFKVKKDKPNINAYEPYHFELIIEGVGNLDKLEKIDLKIPAAKVFASKAQKDYILTEDGYKGIWSQKFAIVSDKNFDFPNINYVFHEKKSNSIKSYEVKPFKVSVKELYRKEDLLDDVKEEKQIFKKEYLYYVLIFISGFLAGKIKISKNTKDNGNDNLTLKVESCKTLDELLVLLVVTDSVKYSDIINKIEYKKMALSEAKKQIIK
ncbi:MAG: hypothetical protein OQJ77_00765, partial [Thiovulaceae bacterium]|nr:hypothetical protein [Sulfurimonadaceae bacterium]